MRFFVHPNRQGKIYREFPELANELNTAMRLSRACILTMMEGLVAEEGDHRYCTVVAVGMKVVRRRKRGQEQEQEQRWQEKHHKEGSLHTMAGWGGIGLGVYYS